MVYHPDTLSKKAPAEVSALTIVIHDDSSSSGSDLDVDIKSIDGIEEVQTNGLTCEMKSNPVTEAAINECVSNMFGSSTRLATWALQMGKIVERANME